MRKYQVADDVVCGSPLGRIEGVEGLRAFMAPFAGMLTSSDLIAAFGDDHTAVLVYNPHTTLVEDAPSSGPPPPLGAGRHRCPVGVLAGSRHRELREDLQAAVVLPVG